MRTSFLFHRFAVLLVLLPAVSTAQVRFHPGQIELARTAADCSYLSIEEQQVFFYLNLARLNGPAFVATYILPEVNLDSLEAERHGYLLSLIEELTTGNSRQVLHPDISLTRAAEAHAEDLDQSGLFQHASSNGDAYGVRMGRYVRQRPIAVHEALGSGYNMGFLVVLQLLIDHEVKDLGHRKSLLDPTMRRMGVAIGPHRRLDYVAVLELADAPIEPLRAERD